MSLIEVCHSEKPHTSLMHVGLGKSTTACIFFWLGLTPSAVNVCLKYSTCFVAKTHLLGFKHSPASLRPLFTICNCTECTFVDLEATSMLSRFTKTKFHSFPLNNLFISFWKVAGALVRPNGIRRSILVQS